MNSEKNDRRSVLMFVSSMVIFGTIGIFRRQIPYSSAFLAFARGILGGLVLLLVMMLRRGSPEPKLPKRIFIRLVITGALIGINWILLFEAYNHTTVAIATLCYYMQPAIVILLSPMLFKEKMTLKKALCAAAAIIGMIPVSGMVGNSNTQSGSIRGILFGLGAAVFYAAVVILNKKTGGIEAFRKTTIQLLAAGIAMVPYLLLTGDFSVSGSDPTAIILLLVVGIVHTGIAYVLYFGSMDGLEAQSIAILSYIDPVSALILSAVVLKEPLSLSSIIGAVMIIGSAIISEL